MSQGFVPRQPLAALGRCGLAVAALAVLAGCTALVSSTTGRMADSLAEAIVNQNGVETVLNETKDAWKYQLITVRGFDCDDEKQDALCREYLRRVRASGERYYKAGRRYKLEGYRMTHTGNST